MGLSARVVMIMELNFKKSQEALLWVDISTMSAEINTAAGYGSDCYKAEILPSHITVIKGGGIDYIADGIAQAHSKGMKFQIILSGVKWAGGNREALRTDINATNYFISDFTWLLQRYPGLDGIELEEPQTYITDGTVSAAWRTFNNQFFTTLQNIVTQYHSITDGTFYWSFNVASNTDSGIFIIGIDLNYINANNLFNAYLIQNNVSSLISFQNNIAAWKLRLPNRYIVSAAMVTYSGLINACGLPLPWNSPTCWNQDIFNQVRWANANNQPISIFTLTYLKQPASMWPSDITPGTTAGEKIQSIWVTPTCVPNWQCEQPLNGYEADGCGNRRLNSTCNVPSVYVCEQPLNGYEIDQYGNKRLNPACNRVLSKIALTPSPVIINIREEVNITVMATSSDNLPFAGAPIIFISDPPGIISIDPVQGATFTDGKITIKIKGLSVGLTSLIASSGYITGTDTIDVNTAPTPLKWKCSGTPDYTCVQAIDGLYATQAECQAACQKPADKDQTTQVIFVALAIGSALAKL